MLKTIREKLFESLPTPSILVVASGDVSKMHARGQFYPFRATSCFLYCTSINEPKNILMLIKSADRQRVLLFRPSYDENHTRWTGESNSLSPNLSENIDEFHDIEQFTSVFIKNYPEKAVVLADVKNTEIMNQIHISRITLEIKHYLHFFANIRLKKLPHEIANIKKSIATTTKAFHSLLPKLKTFTNESEIMAHLLHSYISDGADHILPYHPILGAGENALILHYNKNNSPLPKDKLILIDSGCSYDYYASDITRTYPLNGTYSDAQKTLYEGVSYVKSEIIKSVSPAGTFSALQKNAIKLLTELLIELKILNGSLEENLEKKLYQQFYMHNIGHSLGLDVHDITPQTDNLSSGIVMTIEPGIYIGKNPNVDEKWHDIGIRLEDNILITDDGYENLSSEIIENTDEIERMMNA